jgi:glucose/arabinose dehydrogenase
MRCLALACILLALGPLPLRAQDFFVEQLVNGLSQPVYAAAPPEDPSRLFIVERLGAIRIFDLDEGLLLPEPFIEVALDATGGEQGLLGLAFHPNYAKNGFFYISLTDASFGTEVRRYRVSPGDPDRADPASQRLVIAYSQPFANHNAGWLGFGPDGLLYIPTGDGGGAGDPLNNAQDITDQPLGKVLRLDVNGDDFPADATRNYAIPPDNPFVGRLGDDEIWAFGLRNPFRASFDRMTGDFYIGDVGQSSREEVDFQPADSKGGENYGWKVLEGTLCFDDTILENPSCDDPALVPPIHEYSQGPAPDGGRSVIGGIVYRGPVPSLYGQYIFGDFVSNQIWSFEVVNGAKTAFANRTADFAPISGEIDGVTAFAEDALGNLYFVDFDGEVYRVSATQAGALLNEAVLPSSRTAELGETVTAFASLINSGPATATVCRLSVPDDFSGLFSFQTTDAATNLPSDFANHPVSIPPGAVQSFVFAIKPDQIQPPTELGIRASCLDGSSAPLFSGVNTLLFSATDQPTADVIALALTLEGNGIVSLPDPDGISAFAVAGFNLGLGDTIEVRPLVRPGTPPVTLSICETDAAGTCLGAPAPSVTLAIPNSGSPTFAVVVTGTGVVVPFDPAKHRIEVEFRASDNAIRGRTSVALRTL